MAAKVLVLGSNFGGLWAALSVKKELGDDVDVTVVSPSRRFVFNPSLIWLPFGKRTPKDVTVPVGPVLDDAGVHFVNEPATEIDPDGKRVRVGAMAWLSYDYLVIATGYQNNLDAVPGLSENATTITTLDAAIQTGKEWQRFLDRPGPVVIGATEGASCFGAAYEFLFNFTYQLKKHGLKKKVPVVYATAEPFLGHFGIDGLPHGETLLSMFFKKEGITGKTNVAMTAIDDGQISFADDSTLPFSFAMIIPPFVGTDVVRACSKLSDPKGYVPVRPTYQSQAYDDVYAVGIAAAVPVPWTTPVATGIPKTGYPTEVQAHTAAANIAAQVRGEVPRTEHEFKDIPAICVMDAGNNGVIILADHMLPPRKHAAMIPGPQAHAMKLAFEKYFLWKVRHGAITMP